MTEKAANVLLLSDKDNVAIALEDLSVNDTAYVLSPVDRAVAMKKIVIKENIPFGHKVAIQSIAANETVIKYGYTIGLAVEDMGTGEYVHVHNLKSRYMQQNIES